MKEYHLPGYKSKVVCGASYLTVENSSAVSANFKQELLDLNWLTKRTARHEYFMSLTERSYSYGNKGLGSESYSSSPFSPLVLQLMNYTNRVLGLELNVCFLNKYDDQFQHLGWHADQFPGMREEQPIVVYSYGAEREIWLKDKRGFLNESGEWQKEPPKNKQPEEQRLKLEDGSMFIMPPGYQNTHLHRIPKHDRPCGWRISLTFRSFN
jgi:alkylated DNA repair dioxygenase AlkB